MKYNACVPEEYLIYTLWTLLSLSKKIKDSN